MVSTEELNARILVMEQAADILRDMGAQSAALACEGVRGMFRRAVEAQWKRQQTDT